MSQTGGRRKTKVVKHRRRRPTKVVKRRRTHRGGSKPQFIRSPLMDMPPHVQMDPMNPISGYLADYYMNADIERLSRKMFGAAVDRLYNGPKSVSFNLPRITTPTAPAVVPAVAVPIAETVPVLFPGSEAGKMPPAGGSWKGKEWAAHKKWNQLYHNVPPTGGHKGIRVLDAAVLDIKTDPSIYQNIPPIEGIARDERP